MPQMQPAEAVATCEEALGSLRDHCGTGLSNCAVDDAQLGVGLTERSRWHRIRGEEPAGFVATDRTVMWAPHAVRAVVD